MADSNQSQSQGPTLHFSPISVDRVMDGVGESRKNDIAIIRQTVKSIYPGVRAGNSLTSGLFSNDEFGGGQEFSTDRVTIVKIPLGTTVAQVEAKLANLPQARIYRIMSLNYKDCMTEEQKMAVDQGFGTKTYEEYKETLRAQDGDGEELEYQGHPFYRSLHFSSTPVEDVDLRPEQVQAAQGSRVQIVAEEDVDERISQEATLEV